MNIAKSIAMAAILFSSAATQAASYNNHIISGIEIDGYGTYTAIIHDTLKTDYIVRSRDFDSSDFIEKAAIAFHSLLIPGGALSGTDFDNNGITPPGRLYDYYDYFEMYGSNYWYQKYSHAVVTNYFESKGYDDESLIFKDRMGSTAFAMAYAIGQNDVNEGGYHIEWVKGDLPPPNIGEVPIPASVFLLGPALLGMVGYRRRNTA